MRPLRRRKDKGEERIHLEAPADLELEALVDGLLAAAGFLALGFEVQRQARDGGPAGAEAVGAGRAIREHRARIGGQKAGAEWPGYAIAYFGVQAACWGRPGALGCQARRSSAATTGRPPRSDAAPHVGASVRERPWPSGPGAIRTEPLAPHSP